MADSIFIGKKIIAKNTVILYFRTFITIIVQLYVVPILLHSFGVQDYGIYSVVAGMVSLFVFFSGSLTSASQRFLAFSLGRKDEKTLNMVFAVTFTIYLFITLLSIILFEIIGLWFLNTHMDIPTNRLYAANWVFHFTIILFAFEILAIPFRADIIAHERMNYFAIMNIIECLLKLLVAILVGYISFDKLIVYSCLLPFVGLFILLSYYLYCYHNFKECRIFKVKWDHKIGKMLLSYSGWNMIGLLAGLLRNHGINIIQNIFFGPILNAAHSIAQQVQGAVARLVDNVYIASRPQITKLYAAKRIDEMWILIFQSGRLAFFLMMIISIPAILELDTILLSWLNEVPPYAAIIAKIMLCSVLVETLANQIIAAYQAANRIKRYQIYSSSILLLNIPISYVLLRMIPNIPFVPYYVSVVLSVIYIISIIYVAKKEVGLNVKLFVEEVILRNVAIFIMCIVPSYLFCQLFEASILRIIYTTVFSFVVSLIIVWVFGLSSSEKISLMNCIIKKVK